MTTAQRFSRLLELVLRQPPPLRVKAWDGSEEGPQDAPLLLLNSPDAVRRLVQSPGELGLARAYVSGDLDVPDRLYDVLTSLTLLSDKSPSNGHPIPDQRESSSKRTIPPRERAELLSIAVGLKAVGRTPPPPPEEVRRLRGLRHSRARDKAAISHHYDVGNEFYELVLGPSMVYSCAYWTRPDDPSYTLDDAQRDKLELVCRKLGLEPGMRVLDVGCGWGSFLLHAATRARRLRRRHHALGGAGRPRPQADRGGRSHRPGRDPGAGLARPADRAVRRDREHRHGRARGSTRVRRVRRRAARPAAARRPAAQPPDRASPRTRRPQADVHRPLRLPGRRAAARWP